MRRAGILVESRPVRYRQHDIELPDGSTATEYIPQEKGIDLRLGLDVVRLARTDQPDVAVVFSQDQDLAEAVKEIKSIARDAGRWTKAVSAFPAGPAATAKRGIDGAEWYRLEQPFYDACLDGRDYRPKSRRRPPP